MNKLEKALGGDMEKNKLYFVTSIYLNAFLLAKDFEVIKTARLDSGKVALFYVNSDELHEAITGYKNNVEIKGFVTKLHDVRDMIRVYTQEAISTTETIEE